MPAKMRAAAHANMQSIGAGEAAPVASVVRREVESLLCWSSRSPWAYFQPLWWLPRSLASSGPSLICLKEWPKYSQNIGRIQGEERATLFSVAKTCLVSFKDSDGFRHTVEIEAESLYEAAALAARSFADAGCPPTSGSELQIEVKAPARDAYDHDEPR